MAAEEEGKGGVFIRVTQHPPPLASHHRDLPLSLSKPSFHLGAEASSPPGPQRLPSLEVSREGDLGRKCLPPPPSQACSTGLGSPHFSVIIKLLADQSLVGTAGVLEEGRECRRGQCPHGPPRAHPGSCLGLAALSSICRPLEGQTLERARPGLGSWAPPCQP